MRARAIQLGLRGEMLEKYSKEAILEIIDVSEFIAEQRLKISNALDTLLTPNENIYRPISDYINIRLDSPIND